MRPLGIVFLLMIIAAVATAGDPVLVGIEGGYELRIDDSPCPDCSDGVAKIMTADGDTRIRFADGAWPRIPVPTGTVCIAVTFSTGPGPLSLAKTVNAWRQELPVPLTDHLEISPAGDPFQLSVGQDLRFRVMMGGQPAAGARISYGQQPVATVGSDGMVTVPVARTGLQVFTAVLPRDNGTGGGQPVVHRSTLSFTLE